ncbi:hypothetical protein [Aeoliella sp.]|uniref:hypothetical protein n=1 Tax=Aeoliella sp. TaxID=2795800 RepID=UPI003CCBA350
MPIFNNVLDGGVSQLASKTTKDANQLICRAAGFYGLAQLLSQRSIRQFIERSLGHPLTSRIRLQLAIRFR